MEQVHNETDVTYEDPGSQRRAETRARLREGSTFSPFASVRLASFSLMLSTLVQVASYLVITLILLHGRRWGFSGDFSAAATDLPPPFCRR